MCGTLAFISLKSTENTQLLVPFLFEMIVTVDDGISDLITKLITNLFFFPPEFRTVVTVWNSLYRQSRPCEQNANVEKSGSFFLS